MLLAFLTIILHLFGFSLLNSFENTYVCIPITFAYIYELIINIM